MDRPPRILFLASYYPNRNRPTGPFIQRHAEAIQEYCPVFLLAAEPDQRSKEKIDLVYEQGDKITSVIVYYNTNCMNVPVIRSAIRFFRFWNSLRKGYFLLKERHGKFDLVHLNVIHPAGVFALWLNLFHQLPYILTEHSSHFINNNFNNFSLFQKIYQRIVIRFAKKITTVSKTQGETMVRLGLLQRYLVIPNVINTEIFKPNLSKKKTEDHKIRILHVSNLQHWKGLGNILRALQKVSLYRQDFIFYIVGGEANKSYYESLAKELNILGSFVVFEGYRTESEISDYMQRSDFFILNSESESFCCVMLEAMACGLPIVAPNCGAIPENLNDQRGLLIPDRKVESLMLGINFMLDHFSEYSTEKLFKFVDEQYTPQKIGKQFSDLYKQVLDL